MNLQQRDKKYLWHPLTQHKTHPDCLPIERAQGIFLYDYNDKAYIDAISSWYSAVYGHCHPYILERVGAQMAKLDHVVFAGLTHRPAIELSEKLIGILPPNQSKIFFSDNGSTATEVAIKMALQYHHNRGNKRPIIIALKEGFHGDTFGAMSVSGLSVYNGAFEGFSIEVKRIDAPRGKNNQSVLSEMERLISNHHIAALIYEPLVQGAAAMKFNDAQGLDALLKLCKENQIITIADEVFTGFGKTGKYFASDYIETKPDIICMSKALTAGFLPMGATSCTQEIFDAFCSDDRSKGFFHGHTYTANPSCCTAAAAGIDLLVSKQIQASLVKIQQLYEDSAKEISSHSKVKNVRHLGTIFAFEIDQPMERYGNQRDKLFNYFMEHGVFLRPLGNTVFITPPYIIDSDSLSKVLNLMKNATNQI